jgi:hypothetical protein
VGRDTIMRAVASAVLQVGCMYMCGKGSMLQEASRSAACGNSTSICSPGVISIAEAAVGVRHNHARSGQRSTAGWLGGACRQGAELLMWCNKGRKGSTLQEACGIVCM